MENRLEANIIRLANAHLEKLERMITTSDYNESIEQIAKEYDLSVEDIRDNEIANKGLTTKAVKNAHLHHLSH